jgi:hypothetical protein
MTNRKGMHMIGRRHHRFFTDEVRLSHHVAYGSRTMPIPGGYKMCMPVAAEVLI